MSRIAVLAKVPRSLRSRGLKGTLEVGRVHFRRSRTGRLHLYLSEALFDLRHDVTTKGIQKHEKVGAFRDAFRYEATPRSRIERCLDRVPVEPGAFTFVDLGCGRGVVLLLAARRGFRRIIGVELSDELVAVARANAASYRGRGSAAARRIEVERGDATTWRPPDEPLVLYVYNSFAMPGFERLAQTIEEVLESRMHELFVVYMFPESRAALDALNGLEVIHEDPRFVIYRARTDR